MFLESIGDQVNRQEQVTYRFYPYVTLLIMF